jgi:hypothetical protein
VCQPDLAKGHPISFKLVDRLSLAKGHPISFKLVDRLSAIFSQVKGFFINYPYEILNFIIYY